MKQMARLPIYESKACEGKRAHLSMREAAIEARRLSVRSSEHLDAYQCPFCSLFHAGHRPHRTRLKTLRRMKQRMDGYSVGWLEV